jgi:hypothetical protein
MKNWNSVEEKWREQLQNKSDDIPEGLWSRLEERLEEKPSRRFPIYWAAAAMLLLALGLSWNWNSATEQVTSEETTVVAKTEKTDVPVEKIVASISEPLIIPNKASESTFTKASAKPTSEVESSVATVIQESPKEEIVATTPVIEKKDESPEILTVRLDINPIVEEDIKPAFTEQKRRKSLFGKIVGEIRHALDGEPVNWQKLKEGNTSFENSIHTVANTYVKTEENLKRTLQLK